MPELPPGVRRTALESASPENASASPFDLPSGSQRPLTKMELDQIQGEQYSMVWFDDVSKARFYNVESPTLGAPGRPFFVMPAEDGAVVHTVQGAARYSGMSPATTRAAYGTSNPDFFASPPTGNVSGEVYAIIFPKDGIPHSVPTMADAGGWPHFLEGGKTAVGLPNGGGYLVNPTREFVIPGGISVPKGSILARLGENGQLIIVRSF